MTITPITNPVASARRMSGRTTLRTKLVALLLVLVVAALALAGFVADAALRGYLVAQVDDGLTNVVHIFNGPDGGGPRDGGGGGPRLPVEYYVQYANASGTATQVVTQPTNGGTPDLPTWDMATVQAHAGVPFTVGTVGGGSSWRVVAEPVSPTLTVMVARSLAPVERTVTQLFLLQLGVGLAVVLLLAVVGSWLVRGSLRPLRRVEHTAVAIAGGDLDRRVPESDPRTEIGALSHAFNDMVDQVQTALTEQQRSEEAARASEARMRRFVADASHELRTPLTSIRGYAELYRQGAVTGPEQVDHAMSRIEGEASRMGALVEDLLELARLDQQRPLQHHPVDLVVLATDAVTDARAQEPDRPVTLHVTADGVAPVVSGDEHRLRQVLGNLVVNALRHTPSGTPVEVRVATRVNGRPPGFGVLEVVDHGPGLTQEAAARVFERFYRVDQSRTRADGGIGLGLSIVAGITQALGGEVEVDTAPGQGATFRVLVPLAQGLPADDE